VARPIVRRVLLLAGLLCGCAGSAPADFGDPVAGLEHVEVEEDDDGRRVIGYVDIGGILVESRLDVGMELAVIELTIEGDRLSVASSLGVGGPRIRVEREAWLLEWSDAAPLPDDLEARWLPVVAAWRHELVDDDGFLRDTYAEAINVAADVRPIDGITAQEWASVCPTLTAWNCSVPSYASTTACEIAGAGFCSAVAPPAG
jgi:hypothetical protein